MLYQQIIKARTARRAGLNKQRVANSRDRNRVSCPIINRFAAPGGGFLMSVCAMAWAAISTFANVNVSLMMPRQPDVPNLMIDMPVL